MAVRNASDAMANCELVLGNNIEIRLKTKEQWQKKTGFPYLGA
jgi:hypothetical protein